MSESLVSARGLAKQYGDFVAVDGIDFDVEPGEAFGFLGPNGAGKSTTMRMIGCVSPPSAGSLRILGMDAASSGRQIRSRLGVVPQLDTLDKELTVMENLVLYGRYLDIPRAECRRRANELLEFPNGILGIAFNLDEDQIGCVLLGDVCITVPAWLRGAAGCPACFCLLFGSRRRA